MQHYSLRQFVHFTLFLFLVGSSANTALSQPIALHPSNPHYFSWRGEPTILITSGEHYGALLNLDFDFTSYMDELKAHGLNHTRVFTGNYRELQDSHGITGNTLSPKPNRFICPWARSNEPGYSEGGNKFDLSRWDAAYFNRLKRFMRTAAEREIVVELTLFCPMYEEDPWAASPMNAKNNVNGIGNCPENEVLTLKHDDLVDLHVKLTKKIVRELKEFDNLYYEICNEPYFEAEDQWQYRIVDTIVAAEEDFSEKHLISLNIANGKKKVVDPHLAVSIFNFHYCVPPETVALNYGLNKVIGENETGFRGSPADVLYRTEAWDFLLAGGGLFNHLDYSFATDHPRGTLRDYTSPGGGSVELRKQLGILKRFLYALNFLNMQPDNEVVQKVSPSLSAIALSEKGKAYALYFHVPLPLQPKNLPQLLDDSVTATIELALPAGKYTAEWVNTKTGNVDKQEEFDHDQGSHQLTSPKFANDIALRVLRQE